MGDPLRAVEADASTADGSVEVPLVTARGEATITVPPIRKWRGSARHALFMRADDVTWANAVLSEEDAGEWRRCDPDADELTDFLEQWSALVGEDAGKIRSLEAFLEGHAEAVEADLQRYYQTDLRHLWSGGLSWRRLWVLISNLPMESATQTELRDAAPDSDMVAKPTAAADKFGPWALDNYQLASLIDEVRHLAYLTHVAGRLEPAAKVPVRSARPGSKRDVVRPINAASAAYLNNLRAKGVAHG